jgi:hypothetical protein
MTKVRKIEIDCRDFLNVACIIVLLVFVGPCEHLASGENAFAIGLDLVNLPL